MLRCPHATASDDDLGLGLLDDGAVLKHVGLLALTIVHIAQGDLVGQRGTGCAVAGHFDAVCAQNLLGS